MKITWLLTLFIVRSILTLLTQSRAVVRRADLSPSSPANLVASVGIGHMA